MTLMAMISLLFLTWSVILHQCCSFHIFHQQYHLTDVHTKQKQYSPRRSRSIEVHTVMSKLHAKKQQDDDDDDSKPKSTKFSRMLDDFVGKKYGAGEAFYGKRTSDLSEDQYREYLRKTFPTRYIADDDIELKSNAILVIGDPQVELTQWIILELTDKGFKVRLICEDKKEATKVFGKHGYNIDIVTVDQDTLNSDIDKYVNSIQAVLVTTNFLPTFNILKWTKLEQMTKDKFLWTKRILDRAKFVHELGNASIMKIVFLSRYIPGYNSNSSKSRSNILEVLGGALEYSPSDINLTNQLFDAFRQCHLDFESYIKSLRLEYVIMRAPPMVLGTHEPSKDKMHLLPDVDDSTDSSFQIGSLDFSEGAVAALLLDQVNSVTCSLVSAELSNVGKPIYNQPRPYRNEYYAVLKIDRDLEPEEKPLMDLVDEIYSLRPLERIQEQIVEDSTVETYWSKLFEKFLISERNDEE